MAAGTGLALSAAFVAPAVTQAANFPVTNTDDSGNGSLRAAILSANGDGAADTITFNSGVTGSIHLQSPLQISQPVSIDTSGAGGAVTLDGTAVHDSILKVGTVTGADVTVSGLIFTGGGSSDPAVKGGAIRTRSADLTIHSSQLTGNTAGGGGGAIYAYQDGSVSIDGGSEISANTSGGDGGGILTSVPSAPYLAIQHATVSGNHAAGSGGGVAMGENRALFDQSLFDSNVSGSAGGAIEMRYGDSYVQRSTLTNNRAADGGGVHTFGTYMWVIRSTLSGNQATADGGGVLFESYVPSGSLVYASTLNGNSAGARGGAVAVTVRATDASYQVAQVVDSTIAGNRAGSGAGGVDTLAPRGSRTGSIENSILACNSTEATSGADLRVGGGAGAFEGSFSLVQNVASAAILDNGGNIFGQDPKLAALAANGGLSKTMALTLGSPAVDHGQTGSPPISASSSAG